MKESNEAAAPRVRGLFITPKRGEPARALDSAEIVLNHGLAGDAHARPSSDRQLLLMDAETLAELDLPAGVLKENVTTAGVPLHKLPSGQRLKIGSAVVELTMHCRPCADLNDIRPGLAREIIGRRGVLARVVRGGRARLGDEIEIIDAPATDPER